ncbi:DUF664 domain-containing protein [Streptomyces glaucescens]|uniref:mycothiol transferase n=1 Tax=Streptomyces glaucescens TaxID=1907 RepID=UPI001FCAE6B9|nr:DUF664 domain-containing protein [Streptomyces glaucescens]
MTCAAARGLGEAPAARRAQAARGREPAAVRPPTGTGRPPGGPPDGGEVSLRAVFVHLVEEYARRDGHADILSGTHSRSYRILNSGFLRDVLMGIE